MKTISKLFFLLAMSMTIVVFNSCGDDPIPPNQTDVGVVIDGIRWATRNVDMPGTFARNPESSGRLFQWGTLDGATHHFDNTTPGVVDDWHDLATAVDRVAWTAANDPCPPGWRVPTVDEQRSLFAAGHKWVSNWNNTGRNGRVFGTAPNQIFLPAAGWRNSVTGAFSGVGTVGYYWSSTPNENVYRNAMFLWFHGTNSNVGNSNRANGFSIRCVAK